MTERDATADDGCKSPGDARYPSSPDAADALSRALVRHCADVITVRDAAGARRYVSPAVERVLGYRPEELVGAEALGAIHPDDAARVRAVWTACLAAPGGHVRVTYRARHRDGTWRVLEGTCTNLLHDPAVGGVVINARDVTARLAAEEARRAAERRYRALVERLPAAVYVNPIGDGPVARYISPQFAALTGYTAEEWMADPRFGRAILHAEDRERVLAAGTRSVATGAPFTEEYRYRRKDGTFVWVRDEAVVLRDEAGRPQCWQGLLLDITAQKEAEAALRAGEARLRTQYQALPLPTYTWQRRGDDFVFVDYNAAGDAFARGTLAAKLGQPASDIYRDLPAVAAHLARCCAERRTLQHDLRFAGRDLIITHVSVAPDLVVMHSEDVTERRRAQAALAASEADFRYLFAHNPHPMWVYDVETLAFLEVNDAAVALYGYARDEFLALSIADIRPPEERPDLDANLAEARGAMQTSGPWAHRTKDGRALAVEIAARALAYGGRAARLVVAQDVSARLAAEAALRAEERRARDLRAAAERQARELALLDRVRTALAGPLDPPGIHQAVVQATAGVFAGTQVSLYLRDGDELVRQEITGVAGGASARFARIS
ncbi:MAG TPA: PAS domain S-box protein, partial [Thermomicrobiales bacterium]|nr:PAS domain S-box protein [Thermomicrobiales bacterium]